MPRPRTATSHPLSLRALNRATLARQLLLERVDCTVTEALGRILGLQAQAARPAFVGLWTRLSDFERADILSQIRRRRVVRATSFRGTLHLLTATDFATFRPIIQASLVAEK